MSIPKTMLSRMKGAKFVVTAGAAVSKKAISHADA